MVQPVLLPRRRAAVLAARSAGSGSSPAVLSRESSMPPADRRRCHVGNTRVGAGAAWDIGRGAGRGYWMTWVA